jgi:CheY-like chemotaxis protein
VTRVVAVVPDLMFGSRVSGNLHADGHAVSLVTAAADAAPLLTEADVVLVDLCGPLGEDPAATYAALGLAGQGNGPRTLAVYSHVEAEVRTRALEAGFDSVVPRSRFMREGGELVRGLGGA